MTTYTETKTEHAKATANGHKPDEQAQRDYIQSLIKKVVPLPARPYFNEAQLPIVKLAESKARSPREDERSIRMFIKQSAVLKALLEEPRIEVTRGEQSYPPLPPNLLFSPEITRGLLPERDEYIRYSKEVSPEGYEDFHEGCFWSTLSTIAARRIYADFTESLYTPLYVILAARTSLYAKSVTANVQRKVLSATGLDWLLGADRTTPHKLMSDMAGKFIPDDYGKLSTDDQEVFKLRLAMSGQVGWINDEFGKFVTGMLKKNSIMSDFADLFLTFDNCPENYRNATISRNSEPIHAPYLSMLGCMTFASIRNNAKAGSEFWEDGFWARVIFITPPPNTHKDAPFTRGRKPVPSELSIKLRAWHNRLGVPIIDIVPSVDEKEKPTGAYEPMIVKERQETAIAVSDAAYKAWVRYRSALKGITAANSFNHDLDGSYSRLPTIAIRTATLAASLQGSRQIELCHWALAQEVTERWRGSLHQFYAQVNASNEGPTIEDKILEAVVGWKSKQLEKEVDKQFVLPTAREIGRMLHQPTRDIEPYISSLVKNKALKKLPIGDTTRYDLAEDEGENNV